MTAVIGVQFPDEFERSFPYSYSLVDVFGISSLPTDTLDLIPNSY